LLRKLQLGKPRPSESCRAKARRATAGRLAEFKQTSVPEC